jgi:cytochrome c oxidase subunit 3
MANTITELDPEAPHPAVQRQFANLRQQFEAGRLGLWLLVATELMFFSGLFCAYIACRSAHPEVFQYAHYYLRPFAGALATCVLLLSSLSAAIAVRSIQQGNRAELGRYAAITVFCGIAFLGMQATELTGLARLGLLPGAAFNPTQPVWRRASFHDAHPGATGYALHLRAMAHGNFSLHAATPEEGAIDRRVLEPLTQAGIIGVRSEFGSYPSQPKNAHLFFSLFYLLAGVHALHVLAGVGVWAWLLLRNRRGEFSTAHFGPIDGGALYWHLLNVIWIYLFPLLYLVH